MESEKFEEFINEIKKFRKNRILKEELREMIKSEEETKLKLINPFLKILGYDVEEPGILVSEDIADFRNKKGKKVDYTAYKEGKPLMLIEAKYHRNELSHSTEQLDSYFNTKVREGCRLGLLTNGIEYRFFSDLDDDNKLDEEPFFTFDLMDFKEKDAKILQKFIYESINVSQIQEMGKKLKNYNKVLEILKEEMNTPSDELTAIFVKRASEKRARSNVLEEFRQYLKEAFKQLTHSTSQKQNADLKQQITPQVSIEENTGVTPQIEKEKQIYTEHDHLKNASSELMKIYTAIKKEIMTLEGVELVPTKLLIKFIRNKKDIAEFVFQRSKIRVFINLKYSQINDYQNKLRDVSGVGRWASGECEFAYENIEDMEYLLSFIRQSYNKNS